MTWLTPGIEILEGLAAAQIRTVGTGTTRSRRAYDRAYYHAKRKGTPKPPLTAEQRARRAETQAARYRANPEKFKANARANYWRHRDEYAAAARERMQRRRSATATITPKEKR